jgi:hypothetical protein
MAVLEGFFMRRAVDGIAASSEALFPANAIGAPDYRATDMVRRTLEYLTLLPRPQRRLLLTLFVVVELGTPVLTLGFRRFSRLPVERRELVVRHWRRSRFLPLRLLGDALKATTTMLYMSHPAALAYVGAPNGGGAA